MRIYKGEAGIELTLEAFLMLLEEDALDGVVDMVIDLDEHDSIKNSFDNDGDFQEMMFVDIGEFEAEIDLDGDIFDIFDHINSDAESYRIVSETEFQNLLAHERLEEDSSLSSEDLRIKRIVERFSYIDVS